jgi:hypothetical protein
MLREIGPKMRAATFFASERAFRNQRRDRMHVPHVVIGQCGLGQGSNIHIERPQS